MIESGDSRPEETVVNMGQCTGGAHVMIEDAGVGSNASGPDMEVQKRDATTVFADSVAQLFLVRLKLHHHSFLGQQLQPIFG